MEWMVPVVAAKQSPATCDRILFWPYRAPMSICHCEEGVSPTWQSILTCGMRLLLYDRNDRSIHESFSSYKFFTLRAKPSPQQIILLIFRITDAGCSVWQTETVKLIVMRIRIYLFKTMKVLPQKQVSDQSL